MSKLIKKYQSFLENVYAAQPAREEETITPAIDPGKKEKGMPSREGDKEQFDLPSVSPDPLALADLKDGKRNLYIYNDVYKIEYPSETNCYTVNKVKLSADPQSVIDYINKKENSKKSIYDAEYEKPELSNVTVGPEGISDNFFDSEKDAYLGAKPKSESKSYKNSRNFNKIK